MTRFAMYNPQQFAERDRNRVFELIKKYPFAMLLSLQSSNVTHQVLLLDRQAGSQGMLRGFLSRANEQWRDFERGEPVLAVFQGPHFYVSPQYYITKPTIPTYNYAVGHVYGKPRILDEQGLENVLSGLATAFESDSTKPWSMHEVRRDRLEKMFRGMVAFQVEIERIEGKFKLSQNRPDYDVQKLIGILESTGDPHLTYAAGLMRVNLAMGKNEEFGSNFTTQYAA